MSPTAYSTFDGSDFVGSRLFAQPLDLDCTATFEQKGHLLGDCHPYYPLSVTDGDGAELSLLKPGAPSLWEYFTQNCFLGDVRASIEPAAMELETNFGGDWTGQAQSAAPWPRAGQTAMDSKVGAAIEPAVQLSHAGAGLELDPLARPLPPFPPTRCQYLQDDSLYIGKHPSELESFDQLQIDDRLPVSCWSHPHTQAPFSESVQQQFAGSEWSATTGAELDCDLKVDPMSHPPAKRLHRRGPRASTADAATPAATATRLRQSPSTSRLKKAASFNHREPTRAGRTRPIAKSKSAPHMQTQPSVAATSVPREMQPDHLGTRQRQFAFVNYTIEDKDEILAAVAPSGTMKTRARREQEAREETRRLEEAALAAIIRAGGNPEDLRAFLG